MQKKVQESLQIPKLSSSKNLKPREPKATMATLEGLFKLMIDGIVYSEVMSKFPLKMLTLLSRFI
jgi:hypothetical protein